MAATLCHFSMKAAIDRRSRHSERVSDRLQRVLLRVVHRPRKFDLLGGHRAGASALTAASTSCLETGSGSLSTEISLKGRDGCEQPEQQSPTTGTRVDSLGKALEGNLPFLQSAHSVDQVLEVATEAIELPHAKAITRAEMVERSRKFRALI
jgi:hypothetical protein